MSDDGERSRSQSPEDLSEADESWMTRLSSIKTLAQLYTIKAKNPLSLKPVAQSRQLFKPDPGLLNRVSLLCVQYLPGSMCCTELQWPLRPLARGTSRLWKLTQLWMQQIGACWVSCFDVCVDGYRWPRWRFSRLIPLGGGGGMS